MEKTACFTGHRPEKLNMSTQELNRILTKAIDEAIADGYTTFISGMAPGVDIEAARIVLNKKHENNGLRLICAIPYSGFEKKRSHEEKAIYNSVISKADEMHYICKHYSRSCFQMRNVWMVDRSNRIIAVYNGEKGGTRNTIKYAEKCKKQVIIY